MLKKFFLFRLVPFPRSLPVPSCVSSSMSNVIFNPKVPSVVSPPFYTQLSTSSFPSVGTPIDPFLTRSFFFVNHVTEIPSSRPPNLHVSERSQSPRLHPSPHHPYSSLCGFLVLVPPETSFDFL